MVYALKETRSAQINIYRANISGIYVRAFLIRTQHKSNSSKLHDERPFHQMHIDSHVKLASLASPLIKTVRAMRIFIITIHARRYIAVCRESFFFLFYFRRPTNNIVLARTTSRAVFRRTRQRRLFRNMALSVQMRSGSRPRANAVGALLARTRGGDLRPFAGSRNPPPSIDFSYFLGRLSRPKRIRSTSTRSENRFGIDGASRYRSNRVTRDVGPRVHWKTLGDTRQAISCTTFVR